MNSLPDEEVLSQAILEYLAHPHVMDTLEGIAEWWLMRHHIRVSVAMLARVLQRLTESGVLEELGSGDHQLRDSHIAEKTDRPYKSSSG